MFATLIGTNTENTECTKVMDRLCRVAAKREFVPPDEPVRIELDGPVEGWSLEQKGPRDYKADFLLAVTAPRVPGISPILPVRKTISGPLFAVLVLGSAFVVSREDRRDVAEFKDIESVVVSFDDFLNQLRAFQKS